MNPRTLTLLSLLAFTTPIIHASSLEEITVIAKQSGSRALQASINLDQESLEQLNPIALTDIFDTVPSIGIRTNSRGDTVIRLRGSDERQTALFLDGAPLSVPWDGRVDVGLLPAGLINSVNIIQSAAPVEYGSNAMLGAVALSSIKHCQHAICRAQVQAGQYNTQTYNVVGGHQRGDVELLYAANYRHRDGEPFSDRSAIPFAPVSGKQQDNTDLKSKSFWAAAAYANDEHSLRLSLLSVDAVRGIAPAGHNDPSLDSPRYWRFPKWQLNQITLNTDHQINGTISLASTGWYQTFAQTINQFTDASYTAIEAQEQDDDVTWGLRIVADGIWDNLGARLVANAQNTTHKQIDTELSPLIVSDTARYQQNLYSLGAEIDTAFSDTLNASISASYDYSNTPETGGRQAQQDLSDRAGSAAIAWQPTIELSVSSTLGRRTRFPALRELYGAALGKFLVNPNLQAETAWLGDITLAWSPVNKPLSIIASPWFTSIDNTLSKQKITVAGKNLTQRINLEGSSGYGLDTSINWNASPSLNLEFGASWQQLKAKTNANGDTPAILQRPNYQVRFVMDYNPTEKLSGQLVVQRTGTALDEDNNGNTVALKNSTQIDLRVFYTLNPYWRLNITADNLNNATVLPQLGLPASGRKLSIGISYSR